MKIIKESQAAFVKLTAVFLVFSLLLTTWGIFGFAFLTTKAANLLNVRDTINNSAPSETSNHHIEFTSQSNLGAGQQIIITFDPLTNAFDLGTLGVADTIPSGFAVVSDCTAGASEVRMATSSNPDTVTFTVCPGDTISAGAKGVEFRNNKITNPNLLGSYIIRIQWGTDSGDTRVAIVDEVLVTAQVETSLVFTVTGVPQGEPVNGVITTGTTTASAIPFGVLAVGEPKFMAQQLSVATNARNGFVVTVVQNQNLLSANGADIDLFIDGNANATPVAWVSPSGTLDAENTYGHYGVTSNDIDLNGGEFHNSLFAGNINNPRQIFSHNGPSDGTTQNKGLARVGYRIEITALQEAANDYNNTLTYVCTPTF